MKTNDYLLLTATAAFSYLFFEQNPGINFFIFNVIFITLLAIKNRQVVYHKKWLWAAAMCLVSSACIFIHNSALSIMANVSSLLVLSAFSVNVATSSIFSFLFGLYSVLSSMVYVIIHAVIRSQKPIGTEEGVEHKPGKGYKFIAFIIVGVLSLLFFTLYRQSNPLFAENTKWINLDFISMYWILFTLGAFLVVYGLLYHQSIPDIEKWENKIPLQNNLQNENAHQKRYETERLSGLLLFDMLNAMLLLLNAGDIRTLYFEGGLPKGVTHSDFVHNGVGIIILSILIATGLIMFLFRRNFDTFRQSRILKVMVYAWVLQNLLMLSSTAFRNQIYIHDYNLTYKRIGVYVWLALAVIGLIILFWKVYKERSSWFLIRSNFALWFTVLTLSSTINWDVTIARYNLGNKPVYKVDFYYLFSLSDAVIPELMEVPKVRNFKYLNNHLINYNNSIWEYHAETYMEMLQKKIKNYVGNHPHDWRSYDLREKTIEASIYKH